MTKHLKEKSLNNSVKSFIEICVNYINLRMTIKILKDEILELKVKCARRPRVPKSMAAHR